MSNYSKIAWSMVMGLLIGAMVVGCGGGGNSSNVGNTDNSPFKYGTDAYTGIDNKVYPNIGASAAYTDGELAITFDSAPTILNQTGEIYIYQCDNMSKVDKINFSNATEEAFLSERGTALNIGTQMVRIDGNTLYFTPHFGKLSYGTKYCVVIPNEIISGTLNGKTFTGFSPTQKTWTFTTKAQPVISSKIITVDGSQSSTANFRTVQKALKYVSENSASMDGAVIQIAKGTYRELLSFKNNVSLTLEGMGNGTYGSDVVIQYINGNNMNGSTKTRPVVYFNTSGTVNLINITLKNPEAKSVVAQAETLYFTYPNAPKNVEVGRLIAKNCSFISQQDTLQVNGYNWFKNCYIEGNTDYIWGAPVVSLFENCSLKCVSDGSIICHARCNQESKGFVFLYCNIEAVTRTNYLARDMSGTESRYDNIAFINCTVSGSGTLNWKNDYAPTPVDTKASALEGWKYYGLKDSFSQTYAVTSDYDYELSSAEYEADYSSRATILGRPTSSSGAWVSTNAWSPVEP